MVDEIRHVSSVADEADKILRQFTTTLTQQVTSMQESATVFPKNRNRSWRSQAKAWRRSPQPAIVWRNSATTQQRRLRNSHASSDALDVRVTATGTRLEKAGETATKSMDALADLTQKAETTVLSATSASAISGTCPSGPAGRRSKTSTAA